MSGEISDNIKVFHEILCRKTDCKLDNTPFHVFVPFSICSTIGRKFEI